MSRRTDSLNAFEVGLTSGISDVDTSFPVESTVGLIAPGYLVINPDDPTKREYFKYTIINGSNLEMPNTGFRGLRGSASGASAHLAGARVRAVAVGQWLDDIFSDIEDLEAEQAAFLLLDGSRAMTGNLNMGGKQVRVLGEGVLADDAVTKQYADLIRTDFIAGDNTVRSEFAAADLLLLPLDGTRPMTGNLDIHKDNSALNLLSPDGISRGYRLNSDVTDIADAGLNIVDVAGNTLLSIRGQSADANPNEIEVPVTGLIIGNLITGNHLFKLRRNISTGEAESRQGISSAIGTTGAHFIVPNDGTGDGPTFYVGMEAVESHADTIRVAGSSNGRVEFVHPTAPFRWRFSISSGGNIVLQSSNDLGASWNIVETWVGIP